jgi:hypothetical protein
MCVSFFRDMEICCTYRIGSSATHYADMCTGLTYTATAQAVQASSSSYGAVWT